jgi:acetate kinase
MNILTLNSGSNSLKFEIIATESGEASAGELGAFGRSIVSGSYDSIGKENAAFLIFDRKQTRHKQEIAVRDYGHATRLLFDWLEGGGAREYGVESVGDLDRIGHRVVHGGRYFSSAVEIDESVVRQIEQLRDIAPLHNASALEVIETTKARAHPNLRMFAVFDTVFHQSIPEKAALYALPLELSQRHGIRRYGFHGSSHRYMAVRFCQITSRSLNELRLIALHLEGGSSACAIRDGRSIDTSMGFTPLEGLMMGTRSGDIDPAIVTYLMRKERLDGTGVERLLNKECGLKGVSEFSADTRELREHMSNPSVSLALNMFCYRVRKYIGAYLAVLGGADAIAFGGGIGENTQIVRESVCEGFEWCGAILDKKKNAETVDCEARISCEGSPIEIWVIPTQEGLMIARDVAACN